MCLSFLNIKHRAFSVSCQCSSLLPPHGGALNQFFLSAPLRFLNGNFPCTVQNACNAAHDFSFFPLAPVAGCPSSLRVYRDVCRSVWLWMRAGSCARLFTHFERFMAANMQVLKAAADQVASMNSPVAAVQASVCGRPVLGHKARTQH